jgi:hypothetical protein
MSATKTIKLDKDTKQITIPRELAISESKRKLHIRTPWSSETHRLAKNGMIDVQTYFRHKNSGDKPYVAEGYIEIDGEIYRVVDAEGKPIMQSKNEEVQKDANNN